MRQLLLLAAILSLIVGGVVAQPSGPGPVPYNPALIGGTLFFANSSGGCVWSTTSSDVGPCINTAIANAAAAGGGTVVIPAGIYNLATAIVNNTSGVHLLGAGTGFTRDSVSPTNALAVTRLVWTGAAGATMFLATSGTSVSMYSADVWGILFDCANLANICVEFKQVSSSFINIEVSEPRSIGAWFTTWSGSDQPGNQNNDIWVTSRSTSPGGTYSPTGILFDGGNGSSWNTSFNRIHQAGAWFAQGDGVVFGYSDNNIIYDLGSTPNPGNASGRGVVFASAGYVPPNGIPVNGSAQDSFVLHGTGQVLGFNAGNTVTAGGGNIGTSVVSTQTLATNAQTAYNNSSAVLNFASVSGIANGEAVNCGGTTNGIASGVLVSSFTGTTVTLSHQNIGTVPSGASCVFGIGISSSAVPGTYTITAASASTFNIAAPSGGHSQTGVSYSGGFASFTDMVVPLSGTPATGDTFTVVIPVAAKNITFQLVDNNNSVANPFFDVAASGYYGRTNQQMVLLPSGYNGVVNIGGSTTGVGSISIGLNGAGSASGTNSTMIGGFGGSIYGYGAGGYAGHNPTAGGAYSIVTGGDTDSVTGYVSRAAGANATDRGRYANDCFGGLQFSVQGDNQFCRIMLHGTGSSTSAIRLTGDNTAANAGNCVNIPNNSAFGITVDIVAFDHTTVSKNTAWPAWTGLLTRGANAASTAVTMNGTPTPITNGTLTGQSISITADTTNGCLNISHTPPTGNTDTWDDVAVIRTLEVQ